MRVLIIQRPSLVYDVDFSLSVSARLTEAFDYMADHGIVEYQTMSENDPCVAELLPHADAVFFNKHNSAKALAIATAARNQGIPVILDLDDWVFEFPYYSGAKTKGQERANNARQLIALSSAVTVSNERLLHAIRSFYPSPILISNGIYVEKYGPLSEGENVPLRIVFTNADYLKLGRFKTDFLRVLQDFFRNHPEAILDFYGDSFPEIVSLPFMHYTNRIRYDEFMRCLVAGRYAFSITPLSGNEDSETVFFNSCKNPFKYLNYGAAGIPGIYSRALIYEQCVVPGITGLVVENTYEDWMRGMNSLISNPELRRSIRMQAYKDVFSHFHIRVSAQQVHNLLISLCVKKEGND